MNNRQKAEYHRNLARACHSAENAQISGANIQRALSHLSNALHSDPTYAPALMDVAGNFYSLGFRDAAISYAKRAVVHAPDDTEIWKFFGRITREMMEFSDDQETNVARHEEISSFLSSDYSHKRRRLMGIPGDSVLVRVHREKKFAEAMLERGELRFTPSRDFRETPDKSRKDPNENKPHRIDFVSPDNPLPAKGERVEFLGGSVSIDASPGSIFSMSIEAGGMNSICCFSLIGPHNVQDFLREYRGDLGRHAVVVKDIHAFDRIVRKSLALEGISDITSGLITYVPQEVINLYMRAVLDPYLKALEHAHQFEFRYSFQGGREAKNYPVGPLTEIAESVDGANLMGWIKNRFDIPA